MGRRLGVAIYNVTQSNAVRSTSFNVLMLELFNDDERDVVIRSGGSGEIRKGGFDFVADTACGTSHIGTNDLDQAFHAEFVLG